MKIFRLVASAAWFSVYLLPPRSHPESYWWIPLNGIMLAAGVYNAVLAALENR